MSRPRDFHPRPLRKPYVKLSPHTAPIIQTHGNTPRRQWMNKSRCERAKRARYRHPKYKTAYRVKNWPEYEKYLRNRGDITVWFNQDAIKAWTPQKNGKRGGQSVYSDIAIETSLSLRLLFRLPLRQTEGFLGSIFRLMSLDLPCRSLSGFPCSERILAWVH